MTRPTEGRRDAGRCHGRAPSGYLGTMTTSYGHDQDAEPPTPEDQQPELVEPDSGEEPGSDPDPDPGKSADQAGIDS